jgi:alkaline phosphatase
MSRKLFKSTVLIFIVFALFATAWVSYNPDKLNEEAIVSQQTTGNAKYIFLFIGDGMGVAQRNAAELYKANVTNPEARPEDTELLMNTFPAQGMNTTYDLTSVIPDSASTATAISSGYKTASGVIGMDPNGSVSYEYITEVAKANGWKVGVISSVSIDHATPAAFYSHQPSRKLMYEINVDLANSDFDYFAGGQMKSKNKKDSENKPLPNAMGLADANGFTIAYGRDDFEALQPGVGKVIAVDDVVDVDAAMYYTIDQPEGYITLSEFVGKGIELLDNPDGFFMMVEGGKIDWACHANDAAASIIDTLAFDDSIAVAYEFYQQHPDETLIVVTGDHETGGLTIGYAGTGYSAYFDRVQNQTMSYIEFGKKLEEFKAQYGMEAKFVDALPLIKEAFGLYVVPADEKAALLQVIEDGAVEGASAEAVAAAEDADTKLNNSMALTDLELAVLEDAFNQSMLGAEERTSDDYTYLLYGGYDPLSIKLTTILNQKAGLAWTSYSHTGTPVQTSAIGVGSELFNGYYDQTDIHTKMMQIAGF